MNKYIKKKYWKKKEKICEIIEICNDSNCFNSSWFKFKLFQISIYLNLSWFKFYFIQVSVDSKVDKFQLDWIENIPHSKWSVLQFVTFLIENCIN